MLKDVNFVILQCGGLGTRLGKFSKNKPKCLLSIDGKPLIYHFFDLFPKSKFLLIVNDYNLIQSYFEINPPNVEYQFVIDKTGTGTLGGLNVCIEKLKHLPDENFIFSWCDLLLDKDVANLNPKPTSIGVTSKFECRWSFNDKIEEKKSSENGIAGLFYLNIGNLIQNKPPSSGEFVRWLSSINMTFEKFDILNSKEFGLESVVSDYYADSNHNRYFNKLTIENDTVIKSSSNKKMLDLESSWYERAKLLGFNDIPNLVSKNPFIMEKINGIHPFDSNQSIIPIIDSIKNLHFLDSSDSIKEELYIAYMKKTIDRILPYQKLIPLSDKETIFVRNKKCKNIFQNLNLLDYIFKEVISDKFSFIHGDCTFSNCILKEHKPIWIDPRGYFGEQTFKYKGLGDPNYDWAKLYYSMVGNYDSFNRKQFELSVNSDIQINYKRYNLKKEDLEYFESRVDIRKVKLIHGLIWLSLVGYAKDDIDLMIAAYYNGVYFLNLELY